MTIDLSTLKPGDTMTKFEDELREALRLTSHIVCEATQDTIYEEHYKLIIEAAAEAHWQAKIGEVLG